MAFGNSIKLGNIEENWLFQFGFYNGDAHGNGDGGWSDVTQADGTANLCKGAISDAAATSIDVDDSSVFTDGDFIKINDGSNPEIVKVNGTPPDADTINVIRGQYGTSATTHSDNAELIWELFTPMAFADWTGTYGLLYPGVVLNRPSIRESIDLAAGTAKTSNLSLTIVNYPFRGDFISNELFGGTRLYINHEVRVLSVINDDGAFRIGVFRLSGIETDGDTVNLSLTSHRPWDFIEVPQAKTTNTQVYLPIVYGDFTTVTDSYWSTIGSTSGATVTQNDTDDFGVTGLTDIASLTNQKYHPCPFLESVGGFHYYASGITSETDSQAAYYDSGTSKFFPINTSENDKITTTVSYDGGYAIKVDEFLERAMIFRPTTTPTYNTSVSGYAVAINYLEFTNIANAFDGNAGTYAELAGDSRSSSEFDLTQIEYNLNTPDGDYVNKRLYVVWSLDVTESEGGQGFYLGSDAGLTGGSVVGITGSGLTTTQTKRMTYTTSVGNVGTHNLRAAWYVDGSDGIAATLKIYDFFIAVEMKTADDKPPDEVYIGGGGLETSW